MGQLLKNHLKKGDVGMGGKSYHSYGPDHGSRGVLSLNNFIPKNRTGDNGENIAYVWWNTGMREGAGTGGIQRGKREYKVYKGKELGAKGVKSVEPVFEGMGSVMDPKSVCILRTRTCFNPLIMQIKI